MTDEKKKRPEIDPELYAEFQSAAEDFIKGDHDRLGNMIYTVIKALCGGGMTIFLSTATGNGRDLQMLTGAQGNIKILGSICGFQFGQIAKECTPDEARALLGAFIDGMRQTAPMIDATVEEIEKNRKKGS